jgi:hypothetical protein
MFHFPFQDYVIEIEKADFFRLLKNWVNAGRDWGIAKINDHGSGLAEISRDYDRKVFTQYKKDISIINAELKENDLLLHSLEKFSGIIDDIWDDEQKIVLCYSEQFSIDISQQSNRKKLEKKITEFRMNTAPLGYPDIPESVRQIGSKSIEKHYEIQSIATALHNEIDIYMQM